ncbi:hypothetical protein, partial [Bradyrhizobium sp. 174]|uniref:hypothetical protein n=1 Tax=Bradyrhizobium sp. 174 TaxID=2782645 RepID=UPI001FF74833
IIVCHHKVSTYFGGHLMHQSTQKQKVQGNSRLRYLASQNARHGKTDCGRELQKRVQNCRGFGIHSSPSAGRVSFLF